MTNYVIIKFYIFDLSNTKPTYYMDFVLLKHTAFYLLCDTNASKLQMREMDVTGVKQTSEACRVLIRIDYLHSSNFFIKLSRGIPMRFRLIFCNW